MNREIVLLLSDTSPAFMEVAQEIRKRYGHGTELHTLGKHGDLPAPMRQKLLNSSAPIVVAIGLPAAVAAKTLAGKKVIFCQVFNHQDARLVSPSMKGVSMMPPVREQFRAWKALSPGLKKVGLVTGSNLRWLVDEAAAAAKESGLELIHVEAGSDKETLYALKRISRTIHGFWLVPDNRILSGNVLRELLSRSVKEGVPVLVFSRELLGAGALLSAESRHADVAEQVLVRVRQAQEATGVPGPDLRPLTQQELRVNAVMAERLKLKVPKELAGSVHTPSS